MKTVRQTQAKGGRRRGLAAYALWGVAVIGGAAVLYGMAGCDFKPADGQTLKSLAHGEMAKLSVSAAEPVAPDTPILDAGGRTLRLKDIKGPVRIVNLWATWCPPCVKEMPTLAKLQADYSGRIVVAPVSMDSLADQAKAKAFIAEHAPLGFYQDPNDALAFALSPPAEGFPTTLIYDGQGHELARLSGAADWSSPEARAVVDFLLSHPSASDGNRPA